jgi:hypothetical protein
MQSREVWAGALSGIAQVAVPEVGQGSGNGDVAGGEKAEVGVEQDADGVVAEVAGDDRADVVTAQESSGGDARVGVGDGFEVVGKVLEARGAGVVNDEPRGVSEAGGNQAREAGGVAGDGDDHDGWL